MGPACVLHLDPLLGEVDRLVAVHLGDQLRAVEGVVDRALAGVLRHEARVDRGPGLRPAGGDAVAILRAVGQVDGQLDEVVELVGQLGDALLVEDPLVVGDDVVLEAPRDRPLPAGAQRIAEGEVPPGGGAQTVEDVLEVVLRAGGRGVLQPRVEILDPAGRTVLPDEVGAEHERVVLSRAAGQFGVQLGEVVGLRHQVDVDVDAGEFGELLEQRLIRQLVGVRGLQDVDASAPRPSSSRSRR